MASDLVNRHRSTFRAGLGTAVDREVEVPIMELERTSPTGHGVPPGRLHSSEVLLVDNDIDIVLISAEQVRAACARARLQL